MNNVFSDASSMQWIATGLFFIAVLHTLATQFFQHLAQVQPTHAGLWHLLGEVEVAFGFWALVLMIMLFLINGSEAAIHYIDTRNFSEPLFVFVMMVIAATKPILQCATYFISALTRYIPLPSSLVFYFLLLGVVPILGSVITEPAAITLAALLLRDHFFSAQLSTRFKYVTLGVLLVNISIGGTLTAFAAPPVLMVARAWGWDTPYMFSHFGWKAVIAVSINTVFATILLRKELRMLPLTMLHSSTRNSVPVSLIILHLLFLFGVVIFSHHPVVFLGLFLFFLGIAQAYEQHQDKLILREGLLVAFFLSGLVVLGGQQAWWLQPLLTQMTSKTIFFGSTALTALTDNAALTYLATQVSGLSDAFKYALVAGSVTGGGLTVIANAPNLIGFSILRDNFTDQAIHPVGLLLAAALPTLIALLAFGLL